MNIAIVTGASSGMGQQFVLQLDKNGVFDEIWVIARREERLNALKAQTRSKLRVLAMDLTDNAKLLQYKALLESEKPNVEILVNCSGFGKFGKYDEISTQDCMDMIDLNCKAIVAMTQITLPYIHEGGQVFQLDSLSAFQPVPYINVYAATKAFVLSYSRALNIELKPRKIKVMAVCPGWVKTEFFDRAAKPGNNAVTYFNILYDPADIIKTAIKDMKRGKDVSVHGLPIKLQVLGVKLLPAKLVMRIWMRQQKHSSK